MSEKLSGLKIQSMPRGGFVLLDWSYSAGDFHQPIFACSTIEEATSFIGQNLKSEPLNPYAGLEGSGRNLADATPKTQSKERAET